MADRDGRVEASGLPRGLGLKRRKNQITFIGEVMADDRRAVTRGIGNLTERQRVNPLVGDEVRGHIRDLMTPFVRIDCLGH